MLWLWPSVSLVHLHRCRSTWETEIQRLTTLGPTFGALYFAEERVFSKIQHLETFRLPPFLSYPAPAHSIDLIPETQYSLLVDKRIFNRFTTSATNTCITPETWLSTADRCVYNPCCPILFVHAPCRPISSRGAADTTAGSQTVHDVATKLTLYKIVWHVHNVAPRCVKFLGVADFRFGGGGGGSPAPKIGGGRLGKGLL